MATNKEISIEMIVKIAMLAAKTAVDEILERKQEDKFTRHTCHIPGMKQHRHNGCSPVYTYAGKVNNSLHNSEIFKTKTEDSCKASIVKDRQNMLMESEDNQIVKSIQFCNLKKCKDEKVEE